MSSIILHQLATIRDELLAADEGICAARLQMVIDTLEARPNLRSVHTNASG